MIDFKQEIEAEREELRREERERHFDRLFERIEPDLYLEISKPNWLVDGLIPSQGLVVLAAGPKEGKSCLATALAFAVLRGAPFAGRPTEQGPVLWLSYEESPRERAYAMAPFFSCGKVREPFPRGRGQGEGSVDASLMSPTSLESLQSELPTPRAPIDMYVSYHRYGIDTDDGYDSLEHWMRKVRPALVVIDPLYGDLEHGSLADNATARRVMMRLKDLATRFNCCILVLHHLTKSQSRGQQPDRFADSTQILAVASLIVHMSWTAATPSLPRVEGAGGKAIAATDPSKPRDTEHQTPHTDSRLITLCCRGRGDLVDQTVCLSSLNRVDFAKADELSAGKAGQNAEKVLQAMEPGRTYTVKELVELTSLTDNQLHYNLGLLVDDGRLKDCGKRARTNLYSLPEASAPDVLEMENAGTEDSSKISEADKVKYADIMRRTNLTDTEKLYWINVRKKTGG